MRVFDEAAVNALGLHDAGFLDEVRHAMLAHRRGELRSEPKRTLVSSEGAYATGTHGLWPRRNLAFFHNLVGLEHTAPGAAVGAGYRSIQTLFALDRVEPVLVAQGAAISSRVPVVVSCLAAQALCDLAGVRRLGFIGAGLQARLHLHALARIAPVQAVRIHSRSTGAVGALQAEARALGLQAVASATPRDAIEGADIVVSSISDSLGIAPFLDVAWLQPGALLASVDMLRPWFRGSAGVPVCVVVDEMQQALHMAGTGRIPGGLGFDIELAECFGEHPPALPAQTVRVLMHPGCCASLFGMAVALLRQGPAAGDAQEAAHEG